MIKQSSDNETAPRASRKGCRKSDRSDSHNVDHSTNLPNKKRKSSTGRPVSVYMSLTSEAVNDTGTEFSFLQEVNSAMANTASAGTIVFIKLN